MIKSIFRTLTILVFSFASVSAHAEAPQMTNILFNGESINLQINGGINGMDREGWIKCFKEGNCESDGGVFRIYPVTTPNGQLMAGCYVKQGVVLKRAGDYEVSGGGGAFVLKCPPAQSPQLQVITFGRKVCPGPGPSCTTGGKLEMGCTIYNLEALGPENPFSFTSMPCFNGALVLRDSLNLTAAASIPSSCPPAGEVLNLSQYDHFIPSPDNNPAEGHLSVATTVACAPGNLCNWTVESGSSAAGPWSPGGPVFISPVGASPLSILNITEIFKESFFKVNLSYTHSSGETCSDSMIINMKMKCNQGRTLVGSNCSACPVKTYKDHIGNDACTPCPYIHHTPPAFHPQPSIGATGLTDVYGCTYNNGTYLDNAAAL